MNKLSPTPPKGTADWDPQEFKIRSYIFDTWRRICKSYGYKEYLTPIVEHADVYRAKSGEDVGGPELVTFTDRAGRELCIRPEMTPSVTRMISKNYESLAKPVRLFSIANFMRNERPQRGRNREFWQLNADLFGAEDAEADVEVISLAADLIDAFNPPANAYTIRINSRHIIDAILDAAQVTDTSKRDVVRLLDKWKKLSSDDIADKLSSLDVSDDGTSLITRYMTASSLEELLKSFPLLQESDSLQNFCDMMKTLAARGYGDKIAFGPDIIRGFDYYDGMVFEVVDHHPDNNRAMFGGGRYNGLAGIFGVNPFPSVGFAPGDESMKLFLESWGLLDHLKQKETLYYCPILDDDTHDYAADVSQALRSEGHIVVLGLKKQSFQKALGAAKKIDATHIVIAGTHERDKSTYLTKDIETNEQSERSL